MKERVGDRLPIFSDEQKALLKGSVDFFAVNNYATNVIKGYDAPFKGSDYFSDLMGQISMDKAWPLGEPSWLSVVPWGMRRLLRWIKDR